MKNVKFNLRGPLYVLVFMLISSCTDPEGKSLSNSEVIWEKSISKGCRNKDPFAFGPSSNYNVYIGGRYGMLYYRKSHFASSGSNSIIITKEKELRNVNYRPGGLVKDGKTGDLYLSDVNWGDGSLYEFDPVSLTVGELLADESFSFGQGYRIFDHHIYRVEKDEGQYSVYRYDIRMKEKHQIHTFKIEIDKSVSIRSIYEWEGRLYGTFMVSNSEAPYEDLSSLIQIDLETGEVLWEDEFPKLRVELHFIGDRMYLFMVGENTRVLDIRTGKEVRSIPAFSNDASFEWAKGTTVLLREREYENDFPVREWLKGFDLEREEEIFAVEGFLFGINKDRVYTIDKESMVRVRSITDPSLEEYIDLREVVDNEVGYNYWKMADGTNLILGQKDECSNSKLVLIELQ